MPVEPVLGSPDGCGAGALPELLMDSFWASVTLIGEPEASESSSESCMTFRVTIVDYIVDLIRACCGVFTLTGLTGKT